ncbi:MAG: PglZ domain-containing protein [Candidatus Freyarchaeota archaeon]
MNSILDNEEVYRSFPHYLWLSYIINRLNKNPHEYMRGISPELYDQFERLKIRQEVLHNLAETLQRSDITLCKKQISDMEKHILERKTGARRQFIKLVETQPQDTLAYYSKIAEKDKYTKINLENLFNRLPNYILENPVEATDSRFSQIIKNLQTHWFIENYQEHLQLLTDIMAFFKHQQQIKNVTQTEFSSPDKWISVYVKHIVPLESAHSNIEINPQIRIISPENRKKLKSDYENVIWNYNKSFQRFIAESYPKWIKSWNRPILTADFLEKIFSPYDPLKNYRYTYIVVIDCMRIDVWNQIKRKLLENFEIVKEEFLFALIPSSTIFSRTSIFSGKLPKECIVIPERGAPRFKFGNEKIILARALNIPSDQIEFISQTESVIKVDEIDSVLDSPKNLKVIILDSIDNKIHKAGADDRLGNLKQDFLNLYNTVIESILSKLGESKDTILFVISDHGFVNTNKVVMVEPEKGFINPRYADLNPEVNLNEKWSITISARELGVIDDHGEKRYAFPLGNLSFKLAREGTTVRTRIRDEVIYGHGGLTLQEMIVPCAVLIPRKERTLKPISVNLKGYECMEEKESHVAFEVTNSNYVPIQQVSIHFNIAPPIFFSTINANSSKEFTVEFTPKKEGELEINISIHYKIQDTFRESKHKKIVSVKKNPEIVKRYMDKEFDKLMG